MRYLLHSNDLQAVLSCTDLNADQVAIDCERQGLVWTGVIEQFLATRRLAIMRVQTPFHSLLPDRLRRQQSPPVDRNDDRMFQLVGTAYLPDAGLDGVASARCRPRRKVLALARDLSVCSNTKDS